MNNNNLNRLAEKFWNGETSDSEEQSLRDQLRWGDTPPGLESLKEYLAYTEHAKSKELSESFDEGVLAQISAPKTRIFRFSNILKVAAAVVLLLTATILFNRMDNQTKAIAEQSEFVDTYQDSEEAYREVRNALMMVSSSMNSGMKHTKILGKFDEAKQKAGIKQE